MVTSLTMPSLRCRPEIYPPAVGRWAQTSELGPLGLFTAAPLILLRCLRCDRHPRTTRRVPHERNPVARPT
jgi:hypothetical protein